MTGTPLASLFAGRVELGAVIEAVLEGRAGQATVVGDAARLTIGCYEIRPQFPLARTNGLTRIDRSVDGTKPSLRLKVRAMWAASAKPAR